MKWFPWTELKCEPPQATNDGKPITEPPCRQCKHWKPEVTFHDGPSGQVAEGVRLCHAKDMHHDFSCFSLRDEAST